MEFLGGVPVKKKHPVWQTSTGQDYGYFYENGLPTPACGSVSLPIDRCYRWLALTDSYFTGRVQALKSIVNHFNMIYWKSFRAPASIWGALDFVLRSFGTQTVWLTAPIMGCEFEILNQNSQYPEKMGLFRLCLDLIFWEDRCYRHHWHMNYRQKCYHQHHNQIVIKIVISGTWQDWWLSGCSCQHDGPGWTFSRKYWHLAKIAKLHCLFSNLPFEHQHCNGPECGSASDNSEAWSACCLWNSTWGLSLLPQAARSEYCYF